MPGSRTPAGRLQRAAVLCVATLLTGLLPVTAQAARPIAFRTVMGACPKGVASDSASLRVAWRDADGALKAAGATTAAPNGSWTFCGSTAGDPSPEGLEAGDRITVAERGGTERTYTVPRFGVRIDRQTDVVSGRAPVGTKVHLTVANETQDATIDLPVDADGRFSGDLTDRLDVRGGDLVTMEQAVGRDTLKTTIRAPWIRVWVGRAVLDWVGAPGVAGLVGLSTADRREATAPVGEGSGRGRFLDANGDPVRPRAGDLVDATIVASDARLRIPDVRLTLVASTDVVIAECPAGLRYQLTVLKGGTSTSRWELWGESTGRTEQDLTGRLNVVAGSIAVLDCIQATGDRVAVRRVAG